MTPQPFWLEPSGDTLPILPFPYHLSASAALHRPGLPQTYGLVPTGTFVSATSASGTGLRVRFLCLRLGTTVSATSATGLGTLVSATSATGTV